MKRPQALFLDIDGTILRSNHCLSTRVRDAVAALEKAGTLVCLATGRSWEALYPLYKELNLHGPTVCYNGAMIVRDSSGHVVAEHCLEEQTGRFIVDYARLHQYQMVAYQNGTMFYEHEGEEMEAYIERVKIPAQKTDFSQDSLRFTKAIIFGEPESLLEPKAYLEKELGSHLSATFSSPRFLELMAGGVDKGAGLREVCRLAQIPVSESVAMGDGWNDLALLEAAGDAWVMGGAPKELAQRFPEDRQALHCDEDGAAVVMEAMVQGDADE